MNRIAFRLRAPEGT